MLDGMRAHTRSICLSFALVLLLTLGVVIAGGTSLQALLLPATEEIR